MDQAVAPIEPRDWKAGLHWIVWQASDSLARASRTGFLRGKKPRGFGRGALITAQVGTIPLPIGSPMVTSGSGISGGMTNRIKWLVGAGVVAFLAGGVAPWAFSGGALRAAIARQVAETTGLVAQARGPASFTLLPRPHVIIQNFHASDADGAFMIESDILRGDIRILPLFAGRLEFANATLEAPRIDVLIDRLPGASSPSISAANQRTSSGDLGSISLVHGTARLRRADDDRQIILDKVDLTIDWRGLAAPLTGRGSFAWGGEPVEAALWLGKPSEASRGLTTPIVAKFNAPFLSLALDGSTTLAGALQYDGKVRATSPSLDVMARALTLDMPDLTAFGAASLSATAHVGPQRLTLSDAHIVAAGSSFDGAIALGMNGARPSLSGTLATDNLDLSPLSRALPRTRDEDGRWTRTAMSLARMDRADIDLRVSAARVQLGRLRAESAGLSILATPGHFEASLAEAKAFHGDIKGRVAMDRLADSYAYRAQGTMTHVDFAALLSAADQAPRFSGDASGEMSLDSRGETIADILTDLHGSARLELRAGEIAGLDIEQALRRVERRPLSITSDLRGGKTGFDVAKIELAIDHGVAVIQHAQGQRVGIAFAMNGDATIPTRELGLRLTAWQTGAATDARTPPAQLAMDIHGSWDSPNMRLDTQTLIQRSSAAAPLWSGAEAPAASNAAAQ